jgi:hypothetical protein
MLSLLDLSRHVDSVPLPSMHPNLLTDGEMLRLSILDAYLQEMYNMWWYDNQISIAVALATDILERSVELVAAYSIDLNHEIPHVHYHAVHLPQAAKQSMDLKEKVMCRVDGCGDRAPRFYGKKYTPPVHAVWSLDDYLRDAMSQGYNMVYVPVDASDWDGEPPSQPDQLVTEMRHKRSIAQHPVVYFEVRTDEPVLLDERLDRGQTCAVFAHPSVTAYEYTYLTEKHTRQYATVIQVPPRHLQHYDTKQHLRFDDEQALFRSSKTREASERLSQFWDANGHAAIATMVSSHLSSQLERINESHRRLRGNYADILDVQDYLNKRLSHARQLSPQVSSFCMWAATHLDVVENRWKTVSGQQ